MDVYPRHSVLYDKNRGVFYWIPSRTSRRAIALEDPTKFLDEKVYFKSMITDSRSDILLLAAVTDDKIHFFSTQEPEGTEEGKWIHATVNLPEELKGNIAAVVPDYQRETQRRRGARIYYDIELPIVTKKGELVLGHMRLGSVSLPKGIKDFDQTTLQLKQYKDPFPFKGTPYKINTSTGAAFVSTSYPGSTHQSKATIIATFPRSSAGTLLTAYTAKTQEIYLPSNLPEITPQNFLKGEIYSISPPDKGVVYIPLKNRLFVVDIEDSRVRRTPPLDLPVNPDSLKQVVILGNGKTESMYVLTNDGKLFATGNNTYNQLGVSASRVPRKEFGVKWHHVGDNFDRIIPIVGEHRGIIFVDKDGNAYYSGINESKYKFIPTTKKSNVAMEKIDLKSFSVEGIQDAIVMEDGILFLDQSNNIHMLDPEGVSRVKTNFSAIAVALHPDMIWGSVC